MEDQSLSSTGKSQRHLATSSTGNLEKTLIKRSFGISFVFSLGVLLLGRAVSCCLLRFPMAALNPRIPDIVSDSCVLFCFFKVMWRIERFSIYLLRNTGGLRDGHIVNSINFPRS